MKKNKAMWIGGLIGFLIGILGLLLTFSLSNKWISLINAPMMFIFRIESWLGLAIVIYSAPFFYAVIGGGEEKESIEII